jgi:hypothetical protein
MQYALWSGDYVEELDKKFGTTHPISQFNRHNHYRIQKWTSGFGLMV